MALVAGGFWVLALPGLSYAQQGVGNGGASNTDVTGSECEQGQATNNPHCVAPEVPLAVIYPALGAATFGLALAYRARRRLTRR